MDEEEFEDTPEQDWETYLGDPGERPESPLRPIDLILLPACFLQLVAEAAAMTLEKLVVLLAGHANHDRNQRRFAEAIRHDLESIPTTEE